MWTFVAAFDEQPNDADNCPCVGNPHPANDQVPSFVGEDFFCDTAFEDQPICGSILTDLPVAHPLWNGGGCGPTGGCCESNNPPWFCKALPQPTTDDIEVRICTDQLFDDEDVVIELIEIYIN